MGFVGVVVAVLGCLMSAWQAFKRFGLMGVVVLVSVNSLLSEAGSVRASFLTNMD